MDSVEQRILERLQVDGRISNVQLAEMVGLSESPTFRRVKLLEEAGTIRGYVALLDQRKLGLQVTAYVSVRMEKQPDQERHEFHRCVADEPYIVECHAMSGASDFLMKVLWKAVQYGVRLEDGRIDYDEVERLAREHRPRLLLAGASAYPRIIDFERFGRIAREVGAVLVVDMAHIAGLVATGHHPSPIPFTDVTTTTIFKGVTPFWILDIIRLLLLVLLPGIALYLPGLMD